MPDKLFLDRAIPLAGAAHQCGTVRLGNDPTTSALDVNPSLRIMANALRVGDHLLERLGSKSVVE
ncbi:MAG TPA: hypothetical protein VF896_19865 [Anaerolineales bacterium]